jgi:hypothetical protein
LGLHTAGELHSDWDQDIQVVVPHPDIAAVEGILDQKVELDTAACLVVLEPAFLRASVPLQDAVGIAEVVVDAAGAVDVLGALHCPPCWNQATLDAVGLNAQQPS